MAGLRECAAKCLNGREYFLVLSRATPPLNPFDFNAYTSQSLAGAFMTP